MKRSPLKRTTPLKMKSPMKRKPPRRVKAFKANPELQAFHAQVRALGCLVFPAGDGVTLHHVHGGSVKGIITRGMLQKPSDWAVIPIHWTFHTGDEGIDAGMGVATWERRFGQQLYFLQEVVRRTGVNIWAKMGIPEPKPVDRFASV